MDTSEESVHAHRVSRSALRTHWGRFGSGGLLDTECELRTKKKKLHVAQDGLYILWFWRGRERERAMQLPGGADFSSDILQQRHHSVLYHVSMAVFMRIIVQQVSMAVFMRIIV